jgi:hypothetical protein
MKNHRSQTVSRWRVRPQSCLQSFTYCAFALIFLISTAILLTINRVAFSGMNSELHSDTKVVLPKELVKSTSEKETVLSSTPLVKPVQIVTMLANDSNGIPMQHISLILGGKTGLRQNLRVIMTNENNGALTRPGSHFDRERRMKRREKQKEELRMIPSTAEDLKPWALIDTERMLRAHPLFQPAAPAYRGDGVSRPTLEETMIYLSSQPVCSKMPIFLTMATVGDDLYWQLIENFVYSMAKFEVVDCSLVICVSDAKCMKLCEENSFPCFDYQTDKRPLPSVMEQIGEVKLFHIPKAIAKGVSVESVIGFYSNNDGYIFRIL